MAAETNVCNVARSALGFSHKIHLRISLLVLLQEKQDFFLAEYVEMKQEWHFRFISLIRQKKYPHYISLSIQYFWFIHLPMGKVDPQKGPSYIHFALVVENTDSGFQGLSFCGIQSLISLVALGKFICFLTCKMGAITVSTFWGCMRVKRKNLRKQFS